MNKILLYTLFSFQILFGFDSLSPKVFEEAKYAFETMKISSYNHHKNIDRNKGIYICDCSTFASYILSRVSPLSLSSLPIDKHHRHSRAKNFYSVFEKLSALEEKSGWLGVKDMSKVEAGDIIAWKYSEALQRKNTGHIVIVYKKPMLEKDGFYRVVVLDSSKGRHSNDSRVKGVNDGVGIGTMWFRVDADGKPIGFYWSSKSKKESKHLISIGRVVKNAND